MNTIYKIFLLVTLTLSTMSCNDPDTSPLILEEDFTKVGIIDEYELVTPTGGVINLNLGIDDPAIVIELNSTTQNVDSYTLQGDFYTDPSGNNFEQSADFITVTEFPATISLTLEEVASAFGKEVSELTPGNLVKIHGASVSNGILVDINTIGAGFLDPDAVITGYPVPYKYNNMLFIPL